jgi:hypothetical protein
VQELLKVLKITFTNNRKHIIIRYMNETTKERIGTMVPILNERQRRLFLASEAMSMGRGGITQISRITGVSRVTITLGDERD